MKQVFALFLLACAPTALATYGAPIDDADFSNAVYIRDADANRHQGGIHYWCNASDTYLGYVFDGDDNDACRWNLVDAGKDADGNARYRVQHIASGLFVEGLKYITGNNSDESDVKTPLVANADDAHPLTFIQLENGHYFICDTELDAANGYQGSNGIYNYAMCGNYGNVGGYWREYDFGSDSYGLVTFACEWEVAPAPKAESLDKAPFPENGEEIYIALAPNWSSHGQYLWTSDGATAVLAQLNTSNGRDNDFAAAAFLRVPTDEPNCYRIYHIQSQRYLYGLNFIADSPTSNPLDIYDGDPWDNKCVLTADVEKAHALRFVDNYTYTTRTKVIDYKAKGWTVIVDPVKEEPGDGCHYYGDEFGYCVYSLYKDSNYEKGGFGAAHCGPNIDYYSADPWIVRTPKEMAAHLGLPNLDSQIPVGINTVLASPNSGAKPSAPCTYDLQGRRAASSASGLIIQDGIKYIVK